MCKINALGKIDCNLEFISRRSSYGQMVFHADCLFLPHRLGIDCIKLLLFIAVYLGCDCVDLVAIRKIWL